MKIAVSAGGNDLDSQIDPRFGRCAYFVIVEADYMSFEAFDNESNALGGGAGIQAAQFVASKGARTVITGDCGPNAVQTLSAAGVEVFVGQTGTVREAIERYKRRDIKATHDRLGKEDEIKKKLFLVAKSRLRDFAREEGLEGNHVEKVVCEGTPCIEINKKAVEVDAEMVIIGNQGKSGDMKSIFFGSTAERVLRFITRPVLCIPPEAHYRMR